MSSSTNHMQAQRFEHKYRITEERALLIREFVSSYLDLDEYGVGKPHYSYNVHSLYLDSDELATYWMTVNGDKNRFKLRLRFYNNHPDSPVFFEIKRRLNNIIMKQRGGVRKAAVPLLLKGHLPEPDHLISDEPKHQVALLRFCQLMENLQAKPKMHVSYLREAWVHREHNLARVTFDRQVQGEARSKVHFSTDMNDSVDTFGNTVILELKFTNRYPLWFRDLVEHFGLIQSGAAKYCEGADLIGLERLGTSLSCEYPRSQSSFKDPDDSLL